MSQDHALPDPHRKPQVDSCGDLDAMVTPLDAERWATPTPADGWTVAHQIAHLAWIDTWARQAVIDPTGFREQARQEAARLEKIVDEGAAYGARLTPETLLHRWRTGRQALHHALTTTPADVRVPWVSCGRGVLRTPQTASPDPPWISVCSSPSAATATTWH